MSPKLIAELRRMSSAANHGTSVHDILGLICAALADLSDNTAAAVEGIEVLKTENAVIRERLRLLEARDWKVLAGAVVAAAAAGLASWLGMKNVP